MMNRILILLLTTLSTLSIAQEEVVDKVEVGKHANVNIDSFSMVLSLLMVLLLIFAAAWVLKKFNVVNKSVSGMQVISSLPLGTKERLVVVQVADEQLLLGVSGQQVSLIKTLEQPLTPDQPLANEFGQSLGQFFKKNKTNE